MYEIDKNERGGIGLKRIHNLMTTENNSNRGITSPHYKFFELEAAEVVDIILNDTHPLYKDQRDIGKAKLRLVVSDRGKPNGVLLWYQPMESQIRNFPIKHEIVVVAFYLGIGFYGQRLNIFNSPNSNPFPNISNSEVTSSSNTSARHNNYVGVQTSGLPNKSGKSKLNLGDTFNRNSNIIPLRPVEGDFIIEGRFGNSFRLGSDNIGGNPNLKISVGQPETSENNLIDSIEENIDTFKNSMWVTTEETVLITPATIESDNHLEFASNKPNDFSGNQIILNTDRIILNTKRNEIMGFAKKAINFVTNGIFTIDSDDIFVLNSGKETIINAPQIYLGSNEADEPVVKGNELASLLNSLIDAIEAISVPTGTGPSGVPLNLTTFESVRRRIRAILSNQNFTL